MPRNLDNNGNLCKWRISLKCHAVQGHCVQNCFESCLNKNLEGTTVSCFCLFEMTLDLAGLYSSPSVTCWLIRHEPIKIHYNPHTCQHIPISKDLILPLRFGHTSWAAAATRCCPCARARSRGGSRGAWAGWPAGWWGSGRRPAGAPGGGVPCWPWSGPPGWEGGKERQEGLRRLLLFRNGNAEAPKSVPKTISFADYQLVLCCRIHHIWICLRCRSLSKFCSVSCTVGTSWPLLAACQLTEGI